MTIVLDFDGTCVKHEFPRVGADIGAQPVLKALVEAGHRLILFTMRSNKSVVSGHSDDVPFEQAAANYLDDATDWFKHNDIPLYGIQTNPTQHIWTSSPKAYGELIIDDAALNCPLMRLPGERPYADWIVIRHMLIDRGLLPDLTASAKLRKASQRSL